MADDETFDCHMSKLSNISIQEESICPISKLPNEIMDHIFSYSGVSRAAGKICTAWEKLRSPYVFYMISLKELFSSCIKSYLNPKSKYDFGKFSKYYSNLIIDQKNIYENLSLLSLVNDQPGFSRIEIRNSNIGDEELYALKQMLSNKELFQKSNLKTLILRNTNVKTAPKIEGIRVICIKKSDSVKLTPAKEKEADNLVTAVRQINSGFMHRIYRF